MHINLLPKLLLGAFLAVVSAVPEALGSWPGRQVTVVFRYDDYSSLSPTEFEVRLIHALEKHRVPCTFGVIPYRCAGDCHDPAEQEVVPLTVEKADILTNAVEAGVVEVALHGYSHQATQQSASSHPPRYSEFKGTDYYLQFRRIAKGRRFLEQAVGVPIETFIPPWNSYDSNTLEALRRLGFKTISASAHIYAPVGRDSQLTYLPATTGLRDLKSAVASAARLSCDDQSVVLVLFHSFDFLDIDQRRGRITFQDFVRLLEWTASQQNVITRTIAQAAAASTEASDLRFRMFSVFLPHYVRGLSPSFCRHSRPQFYPSIATTRAFQTKSLLSLLGFYVILAASSTLVTFLIGSFVFARFKTLERVAMFGGLPLWAALLAYTLRDLYIGLRSAIALTCLLGVVIGIQATSMVQNKRRR